MGEEVSGLSWPPTGAPLYIQREDHWKHYDNSVNAVSFGFVATAILISMFLIMAIFERFLRPTSPALTPSGGRNHGDLESLQIMAFNAKLGYPSPKISMNAREVSVLMPGEEVPTFIAHPAPVPLPPEHIPWPRGDQSLHVFTEKLNSNTPSSSM